MTQLSRKAQTFYFLTTCQQELGMSSICSVPCRLNLFKNKGIRKM